MSTNPLIKDALEMASENYREYSLYISQGRAYPCLHDGSKSVHKRAVYGMYKDAPRSIVKVAELSATALKYHPHPTSISGVIVSLGDKSNKLSFLETQGNFGNRALGIEPAADRYIGGRLSDLAIDFLCDSIDYCPRITGELDYEEPEALPALLPLCFINGMSGIPAGLPKLNIPCIDIPGMFDYYIDILKHKDLNYQPKKFPIPSVGVPILSSVADWELTLKTGKGTIKVAPEMTIDKSGTIIITALPSSKNVDNVRKLVEKEILLDKVDLRDESTYETRIVIEKVYKKQCDMQELYDRLYKKLQSNETYNLAFFDQQHIYVPCSFDFVVKSNLEYLIKTHTNRLTHQISDNVAKLEVLKIIEKLKQTNNWQAIFNLDYEAACQWLCSTFKCPVETAKDVLRKPISYLTKEHQEEITSLQELIKELEDDQSDIFEMLLKKYKAMKPRVVKAIAPNKTVFI